MEVLKFVNHGHFTAISNSFQNLLFKDRGHLSDVVLVADDKKFECHKVILSSVCPYFYTMFHSTMKESAEKEIKIHGVSKTAMEALISYIYSGEIVINVEVAQEMLYVADMMNISELKNACSEFFFKNIHASNCLGVWNLARQVTCTELQDTAWTYSLSHFTDVVNFDEFLNLQFEDMSQLIRDPLLNITRETFAVNAVLNWLSNGNQVHARKIFDYIHIDQIEKSYLEGTVLNHPALENCLKTRQFISQSISDINICASVRAVKLKPRIFTGLQRGIFVIGNSDTMTVSDCKTSNVCLSMITNQIEICCNPVEIPFPLLQQNNDELLDSVACCSFENTVYVSGFQGREDQLWIYNPLYKRWSSSVIFLSYRSSHNLVAKDKDTLYAIGGMDPYLDIFDEQIEQLSLSEDVSLQVGTMHVPVKWGGCLYYDNKVLLFGGESWNYTYYHPEATDVIQMFDTITHQTTVLHTKLFSPSDVARAVVYDEKVILMDSDSTWILDIHQLISNRRDTVLDQIVKPGSGSVYFGLELVGDLIYVVVGESGQDATDRDIKTIKYAPVEQFVNKQKQVEWKLLGELQEPIKVCATCQIKIKTS